ncbi:MAG TPA: hypothetical protein VIK51_17695 [Vicinamibacteria bacterium]|jgi:hypothetical protein
MGCYRGETSSPALTSFALGTIFWGLTAATAGRFRVGPAEVQSMYAPEFAARSAGTVLEVGGGR